MMGQQFNRGDLSRAFSATDITFDGQAAEAETVDLRAEARKQEQVQEQKLQKLDNDFARRTPDEDGNAGAPGRIGTAAAQVKAQETLQQRKKEKDLTTVLQHLQVQRDEWEKRLQWLEDWYREQAQEKLIQAKAMHQQIVDNIGRMQENSTFIGAVHKMLKAHKEGDPIDKEQLRKLLKDRGANINDGTSLPLLLRTAEKMVVEADDENALLDADNDTYENEIEEFERDAKRYTKKADEIHEKLEELKSQNLSDEEFDQRADEIWEDVPLEVKREYENSHGVNEADNGIQAENSELRKEEVTVDPMAGFMAKREPQDEQSGKLEGQNPIPPSPGM